MISASGEFSIIIPAFNREALLVAAIDSSLAQTVPAREIIVVDDGSTDRTAEIVRRYASPVRLIQIENTGAGPSRPRNIGIAKARCPYITLLDSDDRLAPGVLEQHRKVLGLRPEIGLVSNNFVTVRCVEGLPVETVYNDASVVRGLDKEQIAPDAYLIRSSTAYCASCCGNFIRTSATTFPKSVWREVGGFDETLRTSEDYAFFLRVLARHDLIYIDQVLHTFVRHDTNLYSSARQSFVPRHCLDHLRVLRGELGLAKRRDCRRALQGSMQRRLLDMAYGYATSRSYASSLAAYLGYLWWGGNFWTCLKGVGKLPLRCTADYLPGRLAPR